jgi:hypothetical protein
MAPAASRYERFCQWAQHVVKATHCLSAGLMMCFISVEALQRHLPVGSALAIAFGRIMMAAVIWLLIWLILQPFAGCFEYPSRPIEWNRRTLHYVLAFGAFLVATFERDQIWATPLATLSVCGLLWLRFTPDERSRSIALAGWVCAAIYPMTIAWPNADRLSLGLFLGGAATAVQGAVQLVRRLALRHDE